MGNRGPNRPDTGLCSGHRPAGWAAWAALAAVIWCAQGCAGPPPAPRDYYFSPRGSDADGLGTADRPFRSIARANDLRLYPGDRVLFEGGQTFDGNLVLTRGGTPDQPVHVGSYGDGRATIRAGQGTAVLVRNAGGVRVADLVCVGDSLRAPQNVPDRIPGSGVEFLNDRGRGTRLRFVRVEGVDASGFARDGIAVRGDPRDRSPSGYDDVRIERCSARGNVCTGILVAGHRDPRPGPDGVYAHRDVHVVQCLATDNPGDPDVDADNRSGSGILVEAADGAVVESCEASGNGGSNRGTDGGPVGIWASMSNRVAVRYCRSHHNRTGGRFDGGGFCLDGGVTNSVVEYNLSHDNDGSGYGLFEYPGAPPARDNVVRHNVSRDDGRRNGYAGIHLWNGGTGLKRVQVYDNDVTVSPAGVAGMPPRVVWVQSGCDDVRVSGNRLAAGTGVTLVDVAEGQWGVAFAGNEYRAAGPAVIRWAGRTFGSVDAWKAATGQESGRVAAAGDAPG